MDHFKNNSLKLENNIDFRRNIDSKKRNFVHPPTRPKNAMNATRNFENQPNHYTFPQKRYLHQNQINHNDFIKKARPNLFLRNKPIPRINANFGQLQNRPHLKPPANPLTLYGVFKGYIFGQISDFGKVSVGTKVVLIKDINNKIDPLSIKVCPQQNFSGENVMGYCDVNTRDALTEILKNANFFKAEGIVCDFDEEIEDPPENQFAAQMKVYLIGPIFSIKKICSYLNHRMKKMEIDLHFYKTHPLFNVQTLEMLEDEMFEEALIEHKNTKNEEKSSENRQKTFEDDLNGKNTEELSGDFREIFENATSFEDLEPMEPGELVKTELLVHQKIGLHWMVKREERKKDKSLFWKKVETADGFTFWTNEITNVKLSKMPEEFRGGILADEMGLGKTIQMIALIATNDFGKGPTLIVCPVSVMNTWLYQIEEHVRDRAFRATIYHGADRNTDKSTLEDFDVVITSYSVVSFEYRTFGPRQQKLKASLENSSASSDDESDFEYSRGVHSVQWFRVVLDEAHKIRSRKSKKHKAICSLWTDRRWCLTGTPVQNKLDDLYSLIRFLQVHPLVNIRFWKSVILNPLKTQDPEGLKKLWTLREYILLRRTKSSKINGKPIVNLPKKYHRNIILNFDEDEQNKYDLLSNLGRKSINRAENQFGKSNVFIFAILTRLRQFCCHPQLLPDNYINQIEVQSSLPVGTNSVSEALEEILDGETICFLCKSPAHDPCVTACFHVFCKTCLLEDFTGTNCPVCSKKIEFAKIFDPKKVEEKTKVRRSNRFKEMIGNGQLTTSPKIEWLLEELEKKFDRNGKKDKSVVFSQWVSMLDIIEYHLNVAGVITVRIDGMKSAQARDLAYRSFQSNEEITVILISLGAGGEGINLTAANRVFLIDPWWNPATEDQAIDRVHRLGQERDVQINKIYMKNSIEEKVKDLQERKRQLVKGTFSKEHSVLEQRVLLSEIKDLFK